MVTVALMAEPEFSLFQPESGRELSLDHFWEVSAGTSLPMNLNLRQMYAVWRPFRTTLVWTRKRLLPVRLFRTTGHTVLSTQAPLRT